MERQPSIIHPDRRQLILMAVLAIALYILVPQIGGLKSSWSLLSGAGPGDVALAIVLTGGTFAAGALTYLSLAPKTIRYARTVVVQLAATFVNRLLPSGIGAVGANYLYLRHERHTATEAGSTVAVNNLLGFTGHMLLLGTALAVFSDRQAALKSWRGPATDSLVKLAAAALALGLVVLFVSRHKLSNALGGLLKQLAGYGRHPERLVTAQAASLALTLCNIASLFFCLHALGLHLPFTVTILVFTLGVGAGSALPTPGGLGGFEAGLAAGFVGYGLRPPEAFAAALLYRLVSYWLPLLAGAAAFIWCQHEGLFERIRA